MNKQQAINLTFSMALMVSAIGCANTNSATKGGVIGAGTGGVLGGIIGKQSGNTAAGAIIGAVVGGAAGAGIGHYMDKQTADLQKDLENAKVERVGEGIKITFKSGLLFKTDATALIIPAKENLDQLAKTLNKYPDTNILIEGNTDSEGPTRYNQELSEDRAESVANYLQAVGVQSTRIRTIGNGEENAIADNNTAAGRQANRRVEVAIIANEKLKKAAEAGQL